MSNASERMAAARARDAKRSAASDIDRHIDAMAKTIKGEIVDLLARHAIEAATFEVVKAQNRDLRAALGQLVVQVEQMKGMFPDEDGAIARALADAEAALNSTGGAA